VLGALIWLAASGRLRAGQMPPRPVVGLLLLFVGIWGFDGLNSYLTFFPGLPYLYAPSNLLRASTGTLEGIAVAALLTPFFNLTIWRQPTELPTLRGGRDLLRWMIVCLAIVLALESRWAPLLYPLSFLSALGVLTLLLMINAMIVALALRRDGMAETWQDAILVLAPGLALALSEILVIDLARAAVTRWLGLPF
jgi:hypothetical protein